jgi:hypothetical protein
LPDIERHDHERQAAHDGDGRQNGCRELRDQKRIGEIDQQLKEQRPRRSVEWKRHILVSDFPEWKKKENGPNAGLHKHNQVELMGQYQLAGGDHGAERHPSQWVKSLHPDGNEFAEGHGSQEPSLIGDCDDKSAENEKEVNAEIAARDDGLQSDWSNHMMGHNHECDHAT